MKRYLLVVILLCFLVQISESQDLWKRKRYETIFGLGTTQFFGDIGGFTKTKNILGFKDITFQQTRFNINGGLRYRILPNVGAKLTLTYGMLHATDSRGSNETRGMDARTSIFEPTLTGEYYFIKSKNESSYLFEKGKGGKSNSIFSALDIYAFTGIGGLSYNVKGNDVLVAQGMKKSGFTCVVPVGVGANLLVMPDFNIGVELGGRYAFSDYLDGYTSQYSSSNDVYYFFSFTFTYKLLTGRNGLPAFISGKGY
jgi:hypothetical protein